MKDFIKWLGVNEKVAKVAVWLLIIMIFLIVTNTMLGSLGFPNYQITKENLLNINFNKVAESIFEYFICLINFFSIVLLVFRVKEIKLILKYAILYTMLSFVVYEIFGYLVSQIFIALYIVAFCYFYSRKNYKYIIFGIISLIFNAITQGIWYSVKASLIDYITINATTKTILSLDYFIIMALIILVKEIYLKKGGEKNAR